MMAMLNFQVDRVVISLLNNAFLCPAGLEKNKNHFEFCALQIIKSSAKEEWKSFIFSYCKDY